MQEAAEHLAQNLRTVRAQRGMTQAKLAERSGVPRSTIAGIEAGGANPTLSILSALSAALRLSLEELLERPRSRHELFAPGDLKHRHSKKGKVRVAKLLPHKIRGMEIDRFEIDAGQHLVGVPHHPGTQEYLFVEKGSVRMHVSGEQIVVPKGHVFTFPADQKHSYYNDGSSLCVGFSVVSLQS